MKDVVRCDKSSGSREQALIREFPNGETHFRDAEETRRATEDTDGLIWLLWLRLSLRSLLAEIKRRYLFSESHRGIRANPGN